MYGGTCQDLVNGFKCICPVGQVVRMTSDLIFNFYKRCSEPKNIVVVLYIYIIIHSSLKIAKYFSSGDLRFFKYVIVHVKRHIVLLPKITV